MQDLPQMTVDEWNQVYIEVHDELYAEIAKQLIAERNQDPVKAYDLNEAFSNMAIEQQAEMFNMENPNPDVAVCALCQQSPARRIKGQEIHCEMTGCVSINMKCFDWTVEQVMIKLGCMVREHKKIAEENEQTCCDKVQNTELDVMECVGDLEFKQIDNQVLERNALALLLQCKECSFFDFEIIGESQLKINSTYN